MDGTVYDFYGCPNWLKDLEEEKTTPYEIGDFLGDYADFLEICQMLMNDYGVVFNVITWLSATGSKDFMDRITDVKLNWIKEHIPFVNEISVVPYGTPKSSCIKKKSKKMILLDDNKGVCEEWEHGVKRVAKRVENNVVEMLTEIYMELQRGEY